jgi:hypothetical protein
LWKLFGIRQGLRLTRLGATSATSGLPEVAAAGSAVTGEEQPPSSE